MFEWLNKSETEQLKEMEQLAATLVSHATRNNPIDYEMTNSGCTIMKKGLIMKIKRNGVSLKLVDYHIKDKIKFFDDFNIMEDKK